MEFSPLQAYFEYAFIEPNLDYSIVIVREGRILKLIVLTY